MFCHYREKYSDLVEVRFNYKVVDISQDTTKAWAIIEVSVPGEEKKTVIFEADYLIGYNSGQNIVHKYLFQQN
jgi:hypothetical protein